jgi:hypothetical protein
LGLQGYCLPDLYLGGLDNGKYDFYDASNKLG